jgi:peptide/nickel transport system ATP-binding protein
MIATMGNAALAVEGLTLELASGESVIEDIAFSVGEAEILGVVGESGSGKTTLALALLGYTRPGVGFREGTITVGDDRLALGDPRALRELRGRVVSYVPQDPGGSLNPALMVGASILDVLKAHRGEIASDETVRAALDRVELGGDNQFERRYAHQLSGGQQQRVAISMATVCEPRVAVLDEPTTGLDVLTQARILAELRRLRDEQQMAMVYVSHDLAVVAEIADRILVMYAGRIVEWGAAADVLRDPHHPYTRALVGAIPDVRRPRTLRGIRGVSVGVGERPVGCAFGPRCDHETSDCRAGVPPLTDAGSDRVVRCLRVDELAVAAEPPAPAPVRAARVSDAEPLLTVSALTAGYGGRGAPPAVSDVSLSIGAGECVALVGESGSGKSTVARCIAGLHRPSAGQIGFRGEPLATTARARPLEARRRIQIVFQNPYASLNPRQRIDSAVERPLRMLRGCSRAEAAREIGELLDRVRLPRGVAERFPGELSGGERQRVAIARALAARPELLICDEVTSALDVSVQASVLELLQELRRELSLSMLFITHNLGVVACIADSVLVMHDGEVRESGSVAQVLSTPTDSYTRALLDAAPSLEDVS